MTIIDMETPGMGGVVTDAIAYVGDLFTNLTLLIVLVIGLPLGFWIIRKVVRLVRVR